MQILIRDAAPGDAQQIARIYGHHVCNGTGTFELDPPLPADMAERMRVVQQAGWPYLVAAQDDRLLGFAYANMYRPRPAYRFSVEDSVYVAPDAQRLGVGRALLGELIERSTTLGARQMVAVIGDSANTGSITLHAALGFRAAGILSNTGWKFGRWLDTVMMQRSLGPGADTAGD